MFILQQSLAITDVHIIIIIMLKICLNVQYICVVSIKLYVQCSVCLHNIHISSLHTDSMIFTRSVHYNFMEVSIR